jgi:cell division protein FtsQ
VDERVPVAVVDVAGHRSLADASGVLFETVTGDPPDGVVPLAVTHPGPGDAATRSGLAAIAALPPPVRAHLRSVSATSGDDVVLHLADGTRVLWGDGGQAAAKAAALAALLHQIDAGTIDGAGTIDVSTPHAVVLR